jgi:thiol-disulfide isomerase/thioredoxin
MKNAIIILSVALVALALPMACTREKAADANLRQSQAASALTENKLVSLAGQEFSLADFKGKVVILDFWDTWCPPCKMEIPHFSDLYNRYKDKGLAVVGIAFAQKGRDAVAEFVKQNRVPYINAIATQEIAQSYGPIEGIPTTFVIDQNGAIYRKYVGLRSKEIFEKDILDLLQGKRTVQ